jgi:HlyD family secretion protein
MKVGRAEPLRSAPAVFRLCRHPRDEITGQTYYTARLRLVDGEREKLGTTILLPGMPVEALIKTKNRTILSYLIKPIKDQIAHALRED